LSRARGEPLDDIVADSGKLLLLGNEAIARGCMEAGVSIAATYPGTPSSEVGGVLERVAHKVGMYFEYSTNEKVAMEVAGAAAATGLRAFAFMKHVGLNVASDAFVTLGYTGVRGGMVVMTADDPTAHSSQNEQDNRFYAKLALVPMLEPSTPKEAKDMLKMGFEISEELGSPVLYRTTTRVNHARGIIELEKIPKIEQGGHFERDPQRFVCIPAHARLDRIAQLERWERAMDMTENSPLNFLEGEGEIGIITSGVSYTYSKEWLKGVQILKLGFTNPAPEKKIADFMKGKRFVIVIEELEPFLEDEVLRIAKSHGIDVPVYGKRTGHLPRAFEFNPDIIASLSDLVSVEERKPPLDVEKIVLPRRPPMLCAGCPHRGTFYAAKRAVGKEEVICSIDIGCYTLGVQPPLSMGDFLLCMGSSIGAAGGFSKATDQKVMAFIGDSTFFHAGVPGLINAVFNDHRFVLVILDNRTTAMTGHQPHPGTGRKHGEWTSEAMKIEPLVKGLGVGYVKTVDPYDVKGTQAAMKEALEYDGVAVIIAERACPLALKKERRLTKGQYRVDQEKCNKCYTCVEKLSCPALFRVGDDVVIEETMCIGCGVCSQVCPKKAIEEVDQ
jgi:indolepyruvate ferredoxin oxidoreductase alpha subunit